MFDLILQFRPQRFSEVWGNQPLKQCISGWSRDRSFPKSILLVGECGTGKTTLARLIAQRIMCEGAPSGDIESCQQCQNCNCPEEIFTEHDMTNRSVDDIRNFLKYQMRHLFNDMAIAYFDELQRWAVKNQEILLKPIEDFENSYFIMSTTDTGAVEKAIISRSVVLFVQKPTVDELYFGLEQLAAKCGICISKGALKQLIRMSNYAPRNCLSILNILKTIPGEIPEDILETDFIRAALCAG